MVQEEALLKPDTAPYLPAAHGAVHAAVLKPVVLPYSPALQWLHTLAPARLYLPSGHMDAVALVDPATHA